MWQHLPNDVRRYIYETIIERRQYEQHQQVMKELVATVFQYGFNCQRFTPCWLLHEDGVKQVYLARWVRADRGGNSNAYKHPFVPSRRNMLQTRKHIVAQSSIPEYNEEILITWGDYFTTKATDATIFS